MMETLEITNLSKRFDGFTLGPVNLTLGQGGVHALLGMNGAGKTTLFRCIMGTVRRNQGFIRVVGETADSDQSGAWKELIGYVGDYNPVFGNWSGKKNLQVWSAYYQNWSWEKVQSLGLRLDINLEQTVGTYSTGQLTKLALIHALAHDAKLLLLDEAANGLDPVARDTFMEILHEYMRAEDTSILYATHQISEIESLVDQLIFIDEGELFGTAFRDDLEQDWRKITFTSDQLMDEVPNQITHRTQGQEHEVVTNNFQNTAAFLENAGVTSLQSSRLSIEQIVVHTLRNRRATDL